MENSNLDIKSRLELELKNRDNKFELSYERPVKKSCKITIIDFKNLKML